MHEMMLGQKTQCQDLGSYAFLLTSTFHSAVITLGSRQIHEPSETTKPSENFSEIVLVYVQVHF